MRQEFFYTESIQEGDNQIEDEGPDPPKEKDMTTTKKNKKKKGEGGGNTVITCALKLLCLYPHACPHSHMKVGIPKNVDGLGAGCILLPFPTGMIFDDLFHPFQDKLNNTDLHDKHYGKNENSFPLLSLIGFNLMPIVVEFMCICL